MVFITKGKSSGFFISALIWNIEVTDSNAQITPPKVENND